VYKPAFVSDADLHPNLASPDVWAMHGRGVQIIGNNSDFNGNPRPTTLTTGVPDLGAYEFYPTSLPTLLTPTPAGPPATGVTQTFMYGTDTVTRITWGANVPPTAGVRRYSGVVPTGLPGPDSMYFYTQVETPGDYDYGMDLFYLNPWQGSIPEQWMIGLGRTTPGNSWVVGFNSRVTVPAKRITQTDITYMNKFTGLINPFAPPVLPDKDDSNRGRRFWVAYAINQLNKGSNQEMVLYLSAQEPANVTVKINGTTWERNYLVPANTVVQTEFLPKNGPDDAFLNTAGLHERGINIESDVPIVVYAHATGSASSGAAMLLPVSVWGYEYKMLGITQNYGAGSFSYFYAVADNDNTVIEVTPTVQVQNAGMTPNVPYQVTLNKGEVFQVVATSQTQDLTGSTIKSISNNTGVCYPVAVFSGTSRTALALTGCGSGGDFMMQQNFPATAWGKRYLTAPSSSTQAANDLRPNIYRIAVRDPASVVKVNGNLITGAPLNATLVNNHYYQFQSNTADFIESDKPIMMAQFLTGACVGVGDPEMIYISPVEQAINQVGFYRNNRENIQKDFLTMIIPTNGLASLKMTDGLTDITPDFVYPHPQSGSPALRGNSYSVVVKMWDAGQEQVRVQSDSSFTAITYGFGSVESYGYNAGTLVKNINATSTIRNTLNTLNDDNDFTCVNSQFKFTATLQLVPEVLTFKLSAVPNLSPNADVTVINPVPVDTIYVNWTAYYVFELPNSYTFSQPGIYPVQIIYRHPDIEGCNDEGRDITYVQVVPAPTTDFAVTFQGCVGGTAQFKGDDITSTGTGVSEYEWTFHNGTSVTGQTTTFTYPAVGSYDVKLKTVTPDGCVGDNTKAVVVNPKPTVAVVQDALTICTGSDATWQIQNPVAGVDYIWYYTPTGGTAIDTTNTFTVTGLTTNGEYYVEAKTTAGCVSEGRKKVTVVVSASGAVPVVTVTATGPDFVTFSWPAIPGSSGYQVSTNGGTTFVTPSSGATGLTHTASGLSSLQTISLIVKSLNACGDGVAVPVSGCASTPVRVAEASLAVCEGTNAVFNVQTPTAGVTYTWFNSLTGGAVLATGPNFTTTGVTGSSTYYVEQQLAACIGAPRTPVAVSILPSLDQAGIIADSIGVNAIRFRWSAVPGAAAYQVSTDGGITFITPSSGATGLTHTVGGLQPGQEATLMVKAIGTIVCQESISQRATARTLVDDIFIPNTFTPNGDGLNDVFRVYGNIIQEVNIMVFNQWGEKVYHGRDRNSGWDGRFKGRPQPSGVYMVVAQFILADGSMISRKASLNLIR
jgi:gliding motility-associated-like protein